jgi:hypothetical protein
MEADGRCTSASVCFQLSRQRCVAERDLERNIADLRSKNGALHIRIGDLEGRIAALVGINQTQAQHTSALLHKLRQTRAECADALCESYSQLQSRTHAFEVETLDLKRQVDDLQIVASAFARESSAREDASHRSYQASIRAARVRVEDVERSNTNLTERISCLKAEHKADLAKLGDECKAATTIVAIKDRRITELERFRIIRDRIL